MSLLTIDDFFWRAILGGVGVATVTGPLGCLVIWRRMAYFGDTLAHAALLGVALSYLFAVSPLLAMPLVTVLIAWSLLPLQRRARVGRDALLGILAHGSLALGLVALAFVSGARADLFGYLFGDVLAIGGTELALIYGGGTLVLVLLWRDWHGLVAATVDAELAGAEGLRVAGLERRFVLALAAVIALAIKVVGVLMITALLIIPAAAARRWAGSPESMAVAASLLGALAVVIGLCASLVVDSPSGPSIVVAALFVFLASLAVGPDGGRR